MITETTIKLPAGLVLRAQKFAEAQGTTLTALTRRLLDDATKVEKDPLLDFSSGRIPKEAAIEALGLRDYTQLLVLLGDSDLPLPKLPNDVLEQQAETFEKLWRTA